MSKAPEQLESLGLETPLLRQIDLFVLPELVQDEYQDPVFRSLRGIVSKDLAGLDSQNDRLEFTDNPKGWIAEYLIKLAAEKNDNVEVEQVIDPRISGGAILDITARTTIAESGLYEQGCYDVLKENNVTFSDWNDSQLQAMVDGFVLTRLYREGKITEQMLTSHIVEVLMLTVFNENDQSQSV
jgi:hypothetical protein